MRQARRTGGRPAMDRNSLAASSVCRNSLRGLAAVDLCSQSRAGHMGEDDKTYSQEIQDRIRELAHSMWEWTGRQQDMALHYWLPPKRKCWRPCAPRRISLCQERNLRRP